MESSIEGLKCVVLYYEVVVMLYLVSDWLIGTLRSDWDLRMMGFEKKLWVW